MLVNIEDKLNLECHKIYEAPNNNNVKLLSILTKQHFSEKDYTGRKSSETSLLVTCDQCLKIKAYKQADMEYAKILTIQDCLKKIRS